MKLVVDLQYFPPITLFEKAINISDIVFDQYENFQKMSFRNRCQIAGGEGRIDLSIPLVKGRDQKTPMKEVRIAGHMDWQERHWRTIVSCYSRSPWFEYYRDSLEGLYQYPVDFLIDWNLSCFEWVTKAFHWPLPFSLTESWQEKYPEAEWIDWRSKLMPRTIAQSEGEGSSGMRYMQVFEERTGFMPNLSVLDALFCAGKDAFRYKQS